MIPRLSPTRLENIYLSVPKSIDRVVEGALAKYEAPQITEDPWAFLDVKSVAVENGLGARRDWDCVVDFLRLTN